MKSVKENLSTWLNQELREKGWSIREFARRANISHAHAAKIVNGEVSPGGEVYQGMAKALGVSPETIMRKAGILPPLPTDQTKYINEVIDILRQLSIEERRFLYEIAKLYYRHAQRKRRRNADVNTPRT